MVSLREIKNFKDRINPTEEIEGRGNFGYYIIRPISLYFTWLILQTKMSANQVTVAHMVIGVIGSVLLAFVDLGTRLIGVLLLYISYILDNVDGEVARYKKGVSITGKYLDSLAHAIVIMAMFFGFGFGAFLNTGRIELVVLGLLAGFFSLRLDILAMYMEAARSVESHLDRNYDYYANVENELSATEGHDLHRISKTASSPVTRFLFAAFAFPGTLNVLALVLLTEFVKSQLKLDFIHINMTVAVLYIYGTLLPLRRILTIRKIMVNNETERKYLNLMGRRPK
jgi:phosphatidylglycerophosphate synthase